MHHSINDIAKRYSELSDLRKDEKRFIEKDFINFAKERINKYSISISGDDMMVSSWKCNDLIDDYRKTL